MSAPASSSSPTNDRRRSCGENGGTWAQQDCLGGHGPLLDVAALFQRAEQRARPRTAARDPGVDGLAAAGGAIDDAFLSSLAVVDRNRALVVVIEQQRYRLAAP